MQFFSNRGLAVQNGLFGQVENACAFLGGFAFGQHFENLKLGRQTQQASTDADEKVNTKAQKAMGDGLGGSHGCQTKQVSRKFSLVKTIDRAKMSD